MRGAARSAGGVTESEDGAARPVPSSALRSFLWYFGEATAVVDEATAVVDESGFRLLT